MDYHIIGSGSSGNAVLYYGDILVDCGLPLKNLLSYLPQVKLILLTHQHQDHCKWATIKKIDELYPHITFGVPYYLASQTQFLRNRVLIREHKIYQFGRHQIQAYPLIHDVDNMAYRIDKIFHATDTMSLAHLTVRDCDYYCIECNYDETQLDRTLAENPYKAMAIQNHLSMQKAVEWFTSMRHEHSELIPLHVSKTG